MLFLYKIPVDTLILLIFLVRVEYRANSEEPDPVEKDEWEVDFQNVEIQEELGKGAFGKVFKAIFKEPPQREESVIMAKLKGIPQVVIRQDRKEQTVAVKTLHGKGMCICSCLHN